MKEIVIKLKIVCLLLGITLSFNALVSAQQSSAANDRGKISPAEALRRYEKLLEAATDSYEKFALTMKASTAALAAGETKKAKVYAQSTLQQADALSINSIDGTAIHVGNLVLGHVVLAEGDVTEAKRLLLEAGKTKGSPPLDTFGPNMRLAKELLAMGEKEVVLQYFDLCAKFWELHHDRLDEWKAIVIKGGIPNFRANLVYALNDWQYEKWAEQ